MSTSCYCYMYDLVMGVVSSVLSREFLLFPFFLTFFACVFVLSQLNAKEVELVESRLNSERTMVQMMELTNEVNTKQDEVCMGSWIGLCIHQVWKGWSDRRVFTPVTGIMRIFPTVSGRTQHVSEIVVFIALMKMRDSRQWQHANFCVCPDYRPTQWAQQCWE